MGKDTDIEWANHTGGPFFGCDPVSPGCANCYAWQLAETRLQPLFRRAYKAAGFADWETRPVWGKNATRVLSKGFWNDARRINAQHAKAGTRGRWFPSMLDWLDTMPGGIVSLDGRRLDPVAVLADFLQLIRETPHLDYLLLTKRPENWLALVDRQVLARLEMRKEPTTAALREWLAAWVNGTPPDNVWLGTSVENKDQDWRVRQLLNIPATVRFLSLEPLLGPVEVFTFGRTTDGKIASFGPSGIGQGWEHLGGCSYVQRKIDWLIIGGESGPGARPCHVEWIRDLVRQGRDAGAYVFVKQVGAVVVDENIRSHATFPDNMCWPEQTRTDDVSRVFLKHPKGGDPSEWPEDLRIREFPR